MRAVRPLRTSAVAPVNYRTDYVILGIATGTIRNYGKRYRAIPWRYAQRASGRYVRITYSNRRDASPVFPAESIAVNVTVNEPGLLKVCVATCPDSAALRRPKRLLCS